MKEHNERFYCLILEQLKLDDLVDFLISTGFVPDQREDVGQLVLDGKYQELDETCFKGDVEFKIQDDHIGATSEPLLYARRRTGLGDYVQFEVRPSESGMPHKALALNWGNANGETQPVDWYDLNVAGLLVTVGLRIESGGHPDFSRYQHRKPTITGNGKLLLYEVGECEHGSKLLLGNLLL